MAKDKKSFILYSDVQGLIKQLPDDVAGRLLKHIYAYVNDENPVSDELLLNIAFEPIKMSLKRDLVKWGETREGRSKAGKASAEAKRLAKEAEQNSTNSTNVDFVQQNSTNSTVSDNVSVSVSVSDNEKENNNTTTSFSFFNSLISSGATKDLANDWIKVRKTKKLTNTETAYKGFISEVEKSGKDINFILKECVTNSWGGFKKEWLIKNKNLKHEQLTTLTEQIRLIDPTI